MQRIPVSYPHYTELSRRAPATMSPQARAELDAHTHAAWRSRDGRTFRLYGLLLPDGRVSYVIRQREEDSASTEPLPVDLLLAEYTAGITTTRRVSDVLAADTPDFLQVLDAVLAPLAP